MAGTDAAASQASLEGLKEVSMGPISETLKVAEILVRAILSGMAGQAETVGAVVRAYLADLRSMGELEAIRPKLAGDAAKMVDKPPLPVSWVEIRVAHEPLVVLAGLKGRDEVRKLGPGSREDSSGRCSGRS